MVKVPVSPKADKVGCTKRLFLRLKEQARWNHLECCLEQEGLLWLMGGRGCGWFWKDVQFLETRDVSKVHLFQTLFLSSLASHSVS